jgi:tubulin polyglutamylase TTLL6/13
MFHQRPTPKKPPGVTVSIENTSYQSVEQCVINMGFHIVWDDRITVLYWCDNNVGVDFCLRLKPWQFVNHFPGTFSISKKVALARNIERVQKVFPAAYNFHPRSFSLPAQMTDLRAALGHNRTFIVKPDLGAQGRGIFLVQDGESLANYKECAVAQEYISPYLIAGLKFDLRIYVLLASVDPLRIYIFREGIARFCTELYRAPDAENLCEIFRHLTNYSVNKHNERFKQNEESNGTDEQSHKRSMSCVFSEIERNGGDTEELQREIDRIVVLTILSAFPFVQHNYRAAFKKDDGRSRCFEILGFDVLIDEDLKPWVLEVNHSPSLSCDSESDMELKHKVITDALRIADIPPDFLEFMQQTEKQKTIERIGGARLSSGRQPNCYSFEREQQIAMGTDWRRLFPAENDTLFEEVLIGIQAMAMGGMEETQTWSKRKVAIREQMERYEEMRARPHRKLGKIYVPMQRPVTGLVKDSTRLTKSVLLLREARLAQIAEEVRRESAFMFSEKYESYVKNEKCEIQSQILRTKSVPDAKSAAIVRPGNKQNSCKSDV